MNAKLNIMLSSWEQINMIFLNEGNSLFNQVTSPCAQDVHKISSFLNFFICFREVNKVLFPLILRVIEIVILVFTNKYLHFIDPCTIYRLIYVLIIWVYRWFNNETLDIQLIVIAFLNLKYRDL